MFAAIAWSPIFQYQIVSLESIQRHFTKHLLGLAHFTYEQRLESLKALSLKDARMMADMVFVYKMLRNICNNKLEDVGFSLSAGNERSGKQRLCQTRARNRLSDTFFKYGLPPIWNKLPSRVSTASSLKQFKSRLYEHLMHDAQAAKLDDA